MVDKGMSLVNLGKKCFQICLIFVQCFKLESSNTVMTRLWTLSFRIMVILIAFVPGDLEIYSLRYFMYPINVDSCF